jgi:hypothetical protein
MKKTLVVLSTIILISCESQDNKMSRLTIDKYSRKLISIIENIVEGRKEEGSQSRLTLNSFYDRYTSKIEAFSNDLNFETISPKYKDFRNDLLSLSKNINSYLNYRKSAISNMSDAFSSYESALRYKSDYNEYSLKSVGSSYSSDLYFDLVLKSLKDGLKESYDFIISKYSYSDDLNKMDSIYFSIDSLAIKFNLKANKSKLEEKIKIPTIFRDTINDWVISGKKSLAELTIPSFK